MKFSIIHDRSNQTISFSVENMGYDNYEFIKRLPFLIYDEMMQHSYKPNRESVERVMGKEAWRAWEDEKIRCIMTERAKEDMKKQEQ